MGPHTYANMSTRFFSYLFQSRNDLHDCVFVKLFLVQKIVVSHESVHKNAYIWCLTERIVSWYKRVITQLWEGGKNKLSQTNLGRNQYELLISIIVRKDLALVLVCTVYDDIYDIVKLKTTWDKYKGHPLCFDQGFKNHS